MISGIFPNSLKIAKVTPIFKKENNKLITNYRPISVLPVISKIFETVISEQLSDYFLTNNLLCPQQYGFKKNSSTELAALELLDRVLDQMDKHKIPTNFYIDLSKAFDSLRHDILLDKLTYYGAGLGSSTVDQVLKYTKYPKYIPSTSTGQVLIFLKST